MDCDVTGQIAMNVYLDLLQHDVVVVSVKLNSQILIQSGLLLRGQIKHNNNSHGYQLRMKAISKQKIEDLFTLKPSRAVDIIFSENKLDQIHDFYAALQQNKKSNTLALKQTLQNNYEKMLYCSELLEKVKTYAGAVKNVATIIERQMEGLDGRQSTEDVQESNPIRKIEGLTRKHKFALAMKQSFRQVDTLNSSQRYLLGFLRIEIVQKMQRHICLYRLDRQKMSEYTKCLQEFFFEPHHQQIKLRANTQKCIEDFGPKSILSLSKKHLSKLKEVRNREQMNSIIYEILFEFKLCTIKNKFRTDHSSNYFEQYFEELAIILKLYKTLKIESGRGSNLSTIFYQCTAQIKSQLSSIFIYREQSGEIIFRCELYEQLIGSPTFETIIDSFYEQIRQDNQQVQNPLSFIKQLWHNYFVNLIDLFLDQANPLARLPTLKQHSLSLESIPDELRVYVHDYSVQQSLHIIADHEDKLKLLIKNVTPIIHKCSEKQLVSFVCKFNQKTQEIATKCSQFTATLQEDRTTLGLRKFLLMRVLVSMLSNQLSKLNTAYNLGLDEKRMTSSLKFQNPECYWRCFLSKYRQSDSFTDAIIDFDRFFIGYLEGVQSPYKEMVLQVISQIAIIILTHVQQQATGKDKDRMVHTVQSLKQKKQKVTILDTIAVPYLAKNIFCCSMKPICLDQEFYESHFVCKPQKPIVKQPEIGLDDFEIGQKQQKQALVKVKVGKSILNLGNNLITGFMKKK